MPGLSRLVPVLILGAVLALPPRAARAWTAADTTAAAGVAGVAGAPDTTAGTRAVDYLWVLRGSLLRAADIDRLLERAREVGVRGLLVQVVGRGDAFYRSDLLPCSEALPDPAFDALGYLLPRAHAAGLEVHAWMNCCLVWSAPRRPRDARHVLNAHPEWVARMPDGRRMTRLGPEERRRLGVEGIYLSPAHPRVRAWIARIAQEIAARYAVDGVHLDYIRQPGVAVGYDPTTRARFALETGVDPERFRRVPAPERAAVDSAWGAFQRAQVTAIVRDVRDSLAVVRPGLPLSAAVLADTLTAERALAQSWRAWLRAGLLDRAFVMSYAPEVQTVLDQLLSYCGDSGAPGQVVPGIAVFNSSAAAAAAKIKGARELGYPLVALYSYDSLFERDDTWPALRDHLAPAAPATR
jgi:uncharacterized lipoprotein YddW (UPF0748 family)